MISFNRLFGGANFSEIVSMVKDNDFNGVSNVENFVTRGLYFTVTFDYKGYRCKAEYSFDENGVIKCAEDSFVAIKQNKDVVNYEERMREKEAELEKYKILLRESILMLADIK